MSPLDGFRQRLLGRRNMYLNTANVHPDAKAAEAMRARASTIDVVIGDLDTFEREAASENHANLVHEMCRR